MKAKFWGVRGSIPSPMGAEEFAAKVCAIISGARDAGVPLSDKSAIEKYIAALPPGEGAPVGGNSACVELQIGDNLLVFDGGSGIRLLGLDLMKRGFAEGNREINIFLSHTHWDHIMGLPFFAPSYIPGNKINFFGGHNALRRRLNDQHLPDHFPVPMEAMAAEKTFQQLSPGKPLKIDDIEIITFEMSHPGDAYGYRIEHGGKAFVYASDTEFKKTSETETAALKDADVLVLDTMYTFEEVLAHTGWGHCSPPIGVDIAVAENVKKLVIFHHEPMHADHHLAQIIEDTRRYLNRMHPDSNLEVILAREGLDLDI